MPQRAKTVDHLGKVQEITTSNVMVLILSQSACAACHAKGACGISDVEEKLVVVHKPNHSFFVGQDVRVILKQSLGFKALVVAYVIPFLLVLIALIILTAVGFSEGKSGLLSLLILVPYYFGLHLFRDKHSSQFIFDIESV